MPLSASMAQSSATERRTFKTVVLPRKSAASVVVAFKKEPTWEIGGLKENGADEFLHNSGALSAIFASDQGSIVIDTHKIRRFNAHGVQLSVTGRNGQGPGEFSYIDAVCVTRGDTIIVSDPNIYRFAVLSPKGEFIRHLTGIGESMPPSACFDDGTFVVQSAAPVRDGRRMSQLKRYDTHGKLLNVIGTFPASDYQGGLRVPVVYVAHGKSLFVADGREGVVLQYSMTGALEVEYRIPEPKQLTDNFGGENIRRDAPLSKNPAKRQLPKYLPMFTNIYIDEKGLMWIEDYMPYGQQPNTWFGYDVTKRTVSRLSFAGNLNTGPRIYSVFDNHALVFRRDADGAAWFGSYLLVPVGSKAR